MQGSKKHLIDTQNDVMQALSDALRERFPCCEKLVGKATYSRMLNKFISSIDKPPKTPNITLITNFMEYVRNYPSMMKFPQADNIMAFEDALELIEKGPNNTPLDYVNMARAITESTEAIVFHPPKGSILLSCDFPIIDIYIAIKSEKNLHKQKFQKPREYKILVWKEEGQVNFEYLKNDEYVLLDMIQAPRPFLSVYGQYIEKNTRTNIDDLLPELCKKGYINHYSLP